MVVTSCGQRVAVVPGGILTASREDAGREPQSQDRKREMAGGRKNTAWMKLDVQPLRRSASLDETVILAVMPDAKPDHVAGVLDGDSAIMNADPR